MLCSLDIRDILLIDRLELDFQPGLNVLTGETGAGKSILLDSLGFVLGWRGRAELVRAGADKGEVVASFELAADHPGRAILKAAGFEVEDELILRRINTREGRKTAWINDRRASGDVLRALSATLVELHGQHDDRGILDSRQHRAMLDSFAALDLSSLREAWAVRRSALKNLADAEAAAAALRSEEDMLRHTVAELHSLAPEPGEEASLDQSRRQMQLAERLRADINRAHQAIGGSGAEAMLSDAYRWLEGAAVEGGDALKGALDGALDAMSRALDGLASADQEIASVMERMEFEPAALEMVEERLFALRGLARKYGVVPDELAEFARVAEANLQALDNAESDLRDLHRACDAGQVAYDQAAHDVRTIRQQSALELQTAMASELAPLKMDRAEFQVAFAEGDAGPEGIDDVRFLVRTNPGAPAGELGKIASGGELSRFLLALKVCLSGVEGGRTLIFDEIDRGVGGATADAVGRRLSRLAEGGQVLVVTHSPQVAALGQHHWKVSKQQQEHVTLSRVDPLAEKERIDEIARMISGETVTDSARNTARELMKNQLS